MTNICGQTRWRAARLNANGPLDSTFNASASYAVFALSLQSHGHRPRGDGSADWV